MAIWTLRARDRFQLGSRSFVSNCVADLFGRQDVRFPILESKFSAIATARVLFTPSDDVAGFDLGCRIDRHGNYFSVP